MRRQFLRVYIGIALVLIAAALVTLFLVDREVRRVVDDRLEETMIPWVRRIRQRLARAGTDPQAEKAALLELDATLPFPVELVEAVHVSLPAVAQDKLDAGRPALVAQDTLRVLYAPFQDGRLIKLGPLDTDADPYAGFWRGPVPEAAPAWVPRFRDIIRTARQDTLSCRQLLERLESTVPYEAAIVQHGSLALTDAANRRLDAGFPHMESHQDGLLLYLSCGPDSLLAVGPMERRPEGRWGRRESSAPGGVRRPPPHQTLPLLHRPPVQGTYLLIGVLLGLLVVIGAAVYWLLRPFEKRIYALADIAQDLGQGQLDRRALTAGTDAIAVLAVRFNEMAERLSGLIQSQQDMLRAVSHELRTPMARLFFLLDDAQSNPDAARKDAVLRRIETSLHELNSLVEELLTFVRLEGQAGDQERTRVELNTLFADVAAIVSDLRPGISTQTDGGGHQLEAVPRLLRRAVLNLATNAVRHARSSVRITAEHREGRVLIHVDDDGPGVPVEARQRIFEPFFRLDTSRSADGGGTGLGLAIVQRVVRLHGGSVSVRDNPCGGARLTMQLPPVPPTPGG